MLANTPMQLKAWIRNMSAKTNVNANIIMQNYMLERLLERISVSKYKNNFILKGGMLISAMVGLDLRNTLDMDATITGFELTKENLTNILNEIISIDIGDGVSFEILMVKDIREEEDYAGYRVTINGLFQTMFQKFKIDITTGDVITPKEIEYQFQLLFEDRKINVLAYNLETVISEKLEGVITKGIANTRARDYYDLYILKKFQDKNIDDVLLKQAIIDKFKERGTANYLKIIGEQLKIIAESIELKELWANYTKKFSYAEDIAFEDTICAINEFMDVIK